MVESLPTMVDTNIKEQVKKQVPELVRDQVPAEISSQIQNAIDNHIPSQVDASKNFEYEAYVSGESSSGQVNENKQGPSTSGNQEQEDDYDFWTESYAADDDEIPTKLMS
ncbi:hypothetical protein Tco_1361014 [Tanacetum coccineum]